MLRVYAAVINYDSEHHYGIVESLKPVDRECLEPEMVEKRPLNFVYFSVGGVGRVEYRRRL